jgi:nucleotide-binding universal stress UspA family protein
MKGAATVIQRILVGVDFRQPSLAAARWAATHLDPAAEVELAHVIARPEVPAFLEGFADPPVGRDGMSEDGATRALDGLAGTLGARRLSVSVQGGPTVSALVDRARAFGADIVVLGRGTISGTRGRTLERLIRHLDVPVLVVGPASPNRPQHVIAAADAAPVGAAVVRWAAWLARQLTAELTLLHVLSDGLGGHLERVTNDWLTGLHRPMGADPLVVRTTVGVGAAGPAILGEASVRPGLLVIGRNGAHASGTMDLGSASRFLLRTSPVPVLVVPTSEAWVPARQPIANRKAQHAASRVPVPAA